MMVKITETLWVNPNNVESVSMDGMTSVVQMVSGQKFSVDGPFKDVVQAAAG